MHYTQLDVYQTAYSVALDVHKLTVSFPKEELYGGGMASQMRRASKSICANLAEGLGKGSSVADQLRFLRMALGSCEEMKVWTAFCRDLSYVEVDRALQLLSSYEDIGKMLAGLIEKRNDRLKAA